MGLRYLAWIIGMMHEADNIGFETDNSESHFRMMGTNFGRTGDGGLYMTYNYH
jgi:hypothetical protein